MLFATLHDDARGDSRQHDFVLQLSLGAQPAGFERVQQTLRSAMLAIPHLPTKFPTSPLSPHSMHCMRNPLHRSHPAGRVKDSGCSTKRGGGGARRSMDTGTRRPRSEHECNKRRGNLEHRNLPLNRRGVSPGSAISAAPAVSTEPSASGRGQELWSGGRGGGRGWIPPSVLLVLLLPELAEAAAAAGGALSASAWSWRNGDVSRSNCAPGGAAGHVSL